MNKKLNLLILLIGFLLIIFGINFHHILTPVKQIDSTVTIKLSFVGDLMCHSPQFNSARIRKDSFDFKPFFREIKSYLENRDLAFGNLETVIAGPEEGFTGYPSFNTPKEYLEALQYTGFDVLFTSNNHSWDRGKKGVNSTLAKVRQYGMIPIGTYNSKIDSDSVRIIEVKGLKIGLQAYSYGLNSGLLTKKEKFLVNLIDTNLIHTDIEKLKIKKTDLIVIYFHFGEEYSKEPSEYQKNIVAKTFSYGADIIIGSHPHVIQPIMVYQTSNSALHKGLVAYSLGNFFSNQRWRYSDAGVILNLSITKNVLKDSLWISNVSTIPTWIYKGYTGSKSEYVILPSDTSLIKPYPSYIKKEQLARINQAFHDSQQMLQTKPGTK